MEKDSFSQKGTFTLKWKPGVSEDSIPQCRFHGGQGLDEREELEKAREPMCSGQGGEAGPKESWRTGQRPDQGGARNAMTCLSVKAFRQVSEGGPILFSGDYFSDSRSLIWRTL